MSKERYKNFEVKANEDSYEFEGYLSTFDNSDRDGDIIDKQAFNESVAKKNVVPMLFNHDKGQVIGKMELTVDEKGLFVKGLLSDKIEKAKEVYELLKFGALDSMSVGMMIKDFDFIGDTGGWLIKSAEVLEGSVVTIPANAQATVTSVKSDDELNKLKKENLTLKKELLKKELGI